LCGGKSNETVSGICARCERKFEILYRKGRLYYCEECLTQIPEGVRTDFEKDTKTVRVRRTRAKDIDEGEKKKHPIKKMLTGIIFIVFCISVYSVYVEFLNQEISIDNIIIEPKEVLSGDIVNIHVYVSKSSSVFGGLINLIDDLLGYSEYFEIGVNEETFKEVVDIGVDESKIYTYPILEKDPGTYVVSVNDLSVVFNVLSMPRFEGHNVIINPNDPCTGENIEVSIFLENIGGVEYTQFLMSYIDDSIFKGKDVFLEPGESKQVCFLVDGRRAGDYNLSFSWETGKKSLVVRIVEPVIDAVTGRYNFWIDGIQYSYYIGLVKSPDGVISNSYGDFIVLINNKNATNPTYSQLCKFLKEDKTDEYPYQYIISLGGSYYGSAESNVDLDRVKNIVDGIEQINPPRVCSDFAEMLHNNAEMSGFRCAYISLEIGDGHALVAFNTTDRGMIYIDDTGVAGYGPSNCDKIVSLKINTHYIPKSLFPEKGWKTTWEDAGIVTGIYLTWDGDWDD
jgi:DNA-directed RNA polymerase subunit RPC12/RpoP